MSTFQIFDTSHIAVLILIAAIATALVFNTKYIRAITDDRFIRFPLAAILLVNELAWWSYLVSLGYFNLPLDFCNLANLLMIWALLQKKQWVGEIAFFWGLAGHLQAALQPDLSEGFPFYSWIKFFISHGGTVLAAVYLAVRGRYLFTLRSVWRVWSIGLLYIALIGIINWQLGTNFGYLAEKPLRPSILDYLGPNKWPGEPRLVAR